MNPRTLLIGLVITAFAGVLLRSWPRRQWLPLVIVLAVLMFVVGWCVASGLDAREGPR